MTKQTIQGLRAEIEGLRRGRSCGVEWRAWFKRVCECLRDAYGSDSPELAGFLEIRFELGGPAQDAQTRLQALGPPVSGLLLSTEHNFAERLGEADEYLLSLVLPS